MIIFTITSYADNTCRIETKHIAYHFREGLFYDNVEAKDVVKIMNSITEVMNNKYNEAVVFEVE